MYAQRHELANDSLESAILAYKQRFDIEEMFRDFKKGGYNLEETNVQGERFITLVLSGKAEVCTHYVFARILMDEHRRCVQTFASSRRCAYVQLAAYKASSLIAIAYTSATIALACRRKAAYQGQQIKRKGIQKYVARIKEYGRLERRHSSFYVGLYGQNWVTFKDDCIELVIKLMKLNCNKQKYYQKGIRAMKLIESTF